MKSPLVPEPYWKALGHRRAEAWQTVLDAEAALPTLRQRDRDRELRAVERRESLKDRYPSREA